MNRMNDDTISRQAAIDAIAEIVSSMSVCLSIDECHGMKRMQGLAVRALEQLPSAQPEPIKINIEDFNKEEWERLKKEWGNTPITVLPAQPEAKPPKWVAEDRYVKNRFAVFPRCPQCNAKVTTGQCYCMICGQHIDWSEDDG